MVYFRIICYIHSLARGNNSKSIRKLLVDKRSQTNLMFFLFPPSFVLIVSMGVLPIWHRILWWRAVLWGQPTLLFLVFLKTCSCCNFFSKSSVHLKNSLKWHTKMNSHYITIEDYYVWTCKKKNVNILIWILNLITKFG